MLTKDDNGTTRVAAVPSILTVARLATSIAHVEVGGETLTQSAADSTPTSASLYNYYGPTEVGIWALRRMIVRSQLPEQLPSIGRPLPNVSCYIVD